MVKSILSLFVLAGLCTCGYGQGSFSSISSPLLIKKLTGAITLDGVSDESGWASATSMPFMVLDPIWGQAPTEKTELFVTYDDNFLYAAGRCFTADTTKIINRTLTRDGYRGDDWMTLHFDSRFDKQNALVFSIYPSGCRIDIATGNDAVELGSSTTNLSFNMFWEAKAVVNKEGWFWEMKIPLYNLRYKKNAAGLVEMGISSTRAIQHKQEYHHFPSAPQNAIDPIMKPSLKHPAVFEQLNKQKLFLLTPYLLASRTRNHKIIDNDLSTDKKWRNTAGLDAKIGVSSYLTLDLTANPDFSQVEVDDQLINLTRFSLFFPERRLFFQEQAGLFEFGLGGSSQLFYSRRIGINNGQLTDIYGGGRLTGKLSKNTDIGILNMQSAPVSLADGNEQPSENFGVVRLRQKVFNDRSFVGAMLTNRINNRQQNYAFGLDALLNPSGNHYIFANLANSLDQNSTGNGQHDWLKSSRLSLLWETRRTDKLHHKLGYIYSGNQFNPMIGFVDRSNFHNYSFILTYGKFAKQRKGLFQFKKWDILNVNAYQNAENATLETIDVGSGLLLRTFRSVGFSFGATFHREYLSNALNFGNDILIDQGTYHFYTLRFGIAQPSYKQTRLPVRIALGRFFDGHRFNLNFSPTFNLGKHWEIKSTYDFTYLDFEKKGIYQPIHIGRIQVNYAFDLHFSINYICQYNSSVNQFFNNLRFRYNFKDGHDLYLVWNENFYENRRIDDSVLRPVSGNQAFILKYSYTFDKLLR
jgi:Domain of unknown function (DUF5916)